MDDDEGKPDEPNDTHTVVRFWKYFEVEGPSRTVIATVVLVGIFALLGLLIYVAVKPSSPHSQPTPNPIPTTASPTPAPTSTVKPASITARCSISQSLKPGVTLQLTYQISTSSAVLAGLGAGLCDNQGNDHSNGRYDRDAFPLTAGSHTYTRLVAIPASLPPGRYELDAEIWPPNHVGQNGYNTWADATCGYMTVP